MEQQPGLKIVESLSSDILELWAESIRLHPGETDLVACIERQDGDQVSVAISARAAFIEVLSDAGREDLGTAWDTLRMPAGDLDGTPRESAIWVVLQLSDQECAIMRLVHQPVTSSGGTA